MFAIRELPNFVQFFLIEENAKWKTQSKSCVFNHEVPTPQPPTPRFAHGSQTVQLDQTQNLSEIAVRCQQAATAADSRGCCLQESGKAVRVRFSEERVKELRVPPRPGGSLCV